MRILFIDIDTLRPDHMGCYGCIRFDQYYCSDAPCLPSRASLVSGMFGIHNGAVGHGGTAADRRLTGCPRDFTDIVDDNCFHNIFRKAGMHTASVSTFPERHSSWWFNAGFNECYNVGGHGNESGEEVLPVALDWLRRNRERDNWFLHVHFWDPHTPYRAPESFGNPFAEVPLDTWIDEAVLEEHKKAVGPHGINELGMYTDQIAPGYPRMPGSAQDMAAHHGRVRHGHPLRGLPGGAAVGFAERTGPLRGHGHFHHLGPRGEHGRAGHLLGARDGGLPHLPHPLYHEVARLQGGLGGQRPPLQPGFAAHHGPAAGGGALGEVGRPKLCPGCHRGEGRRTGVPGALPDGPRVPALGAVWGLDLHPHPPRRVPPL